jgi:hypothetical protein
MTRLYVIMLLQITSVMVTRVSTDTLAGLPGGLQLLLLLLLLICQSLALLDLSDQLWQYTLLVRLFSCQAAPNLKSSSNVTKHEAQASSWCVNCCHPSKFGCTLHPLLLDARCRLACVGLPVYVLCRHAAQPSDSRLRRNRQ